MSVKKLNIIILLIMLCAALASAGSFKLGGYYRSWAQSDYPPSRIPFDRLTHIFHAFAWQESDGRLAYDAAFLNSELLQKAHQANVKVLLALGGAVNSGGFAAMAANDNARTRFIENVAQFLQTHHYDGVDIDWEFPESATDRLNLVKLVNELRQKLDTLSGDLLITMAVPVSDWYGRWFQFEVLKNMVDWFNAMTYDFHGSWTAHSGHNAPLYSPSPQVDACGSVDDGIRYLLNERGLPPEKILLGLAFYGREFNSHGLYQSATGGDVTYGYADIVALIGQGWNYRWDDISKVPYLINSASEKLITYDDTLSIALKCRYALYNHLAGCMTWALGHDQLGDRQPLLQKASEILQIRTDLEESPENLLPAQLELHVQPNPLQAHVTFRLIFRTKQRINLRLWDLNGRLVATIIHNKEFSEGEYSLNWQAAGLAAGAYIVELQSNFQTINQKLVLLK
ncbi:glycosyl hydrolase family 18 protein [Caldithrix abyssi]